MHGFVPVLFSRPSMPLVSIFIRRLCSLWVALSFVRALCAEPGETVDATFPRAPVDWLETQVTLACRGFSGGAIDGIRGPQSVAALAAFQRREGIEPSGELDAATLERLTLAQPALAEFSLTKKDLASLVAVPPTWLEKSQQPALGYATALELAAERFHAGPAFLRRLNPGLKWEEISPETTFRAPAITRVEKSALGLAARVEIRLAERVLEILDQDSRVIAHFPVSIARKAEKRPLGDLRVTVVVPDPDYTFDPAVFPESAEARELGRKLMIPPGPNNPVGVAWVGLDRPGYGIHGTPDPEKVGRTESHGCFRLANWDARTLLALAWVGLPVAVEP
ncbi:MAG: L,D-transpeptidase [Opitutaceae bacterium]